MTPAEACENLIHSIQATILLSPAYIKLIQTNLPSQHLPETLRHLDWVDEEINLKNGNVLPSKTYSMKILQALNPQKTERGLEVGFSYGLHSAYLSHFCQHVTHYGDTVGDSLEQIANTTSLSWHQHPWHHLGPFDVIWITDEPKQPNWNQLLTLLATGGRICHIACAHHPALIQVHTKQSSGLITKTIGHCSRPTYRRNGFVF